MAGLDSVASAVGGVSAPLTTLGQKLIELIPGILYGIVVLFFGYIVGKLVGVGIERVLVKLGFDVWFRKTGYNKALGKISASHIIGALFKYYIIALFVAEAFTLADLGGLSSIIVAIALWIPKLLVGVLIVYAGLIFVDIVGRKMEHAKHIKWLHKLTPLFKFIVVILFIDAALAQVGVQIILAQTTFLVLLGGIVLALSLAIGISFGFAFRSEATKYIQKLRKSL